MLGSATSLGERIYKRARLAGEFRLRSGATSSEYFDKYPFESDPPLILEIAEVLVGLLPAGVEIAKSELASTVLHVRVLLWLRVVEDPRPQGRPGRPPAVH
jgi:hypothetical protein